MSLFDYQASRQLGADDVPFYALIMAAMRKADTDNLGKLQAAWPDVYEELMKRYWAPGGLLEDEQPSSLPYPWCPEPYRCMKLGSCPRDPNCGE